MKGSSTVLKASGAPRDASLSQHWTDDRQLETLIGELEGLARRPTSKKRKRDPEPIDGVLSDIIALTYSSAQTVIEPSRMAALELCADHRNSDGVAVTVGASVPSRPTRKGGHL